MMKRRVTFGVTFGVTIAMAVLMRATIARAEGGSTDAEDAEEVTVRGSHAGGFESRARIEDAPREVTDAASLVEPLPGVHVRRLGADDSFATLSIRGSSSTEVAVYLAGVPLTGGADPTLDLATLPLWPGARARVYRSFAPAAIGPGSLGGTMVLDPPTAAGPERSEVWAAAGAFGARRVRVGDVRALDDRPDGARVAMALSASRSDDDFSFFDPDGVLRTRENAGHAQVGALVGWSVPVRLGDGAPGRLTVTTLAQARRQDLAGNVYYPTPNQRLDSDRELGAIELSAPAGRGAWSVRAWTRRDGLRLSDHPREGQVPGPSHTDDKIAAFGGSAGWRGRLLDDVRIDARVDGSGERFAPGTWIDGAPPPGATRASIGLASDLEWDATRALTASASGRVDTWHDGGDAGTPRDEVRPTAHVGGELRAGPVAFASHAGAVARAPSFLERYGDRGAFVGDPALKPESAWTVDLGARTATRAGALKLRAELVGFSTWADDLIVFVPVGFGTAKARNIGRARIAGVEAELGARVYGFELRASYTGLATADESRCQLVSGNLGGDPCPSRPPLVGRPAHDVVGDATYDLGPLRVRYGVDVVSGIYADLDGTHQVPTRVLQSTGARFDVPWVPGLRLAVDVRNLFDVRVGTFVDTSGATQRVPIGDVFAYPLPGRSALFTARWAYERAPKTP